MIAPPDIYNNTYYALKAANHMLDKICLKLAACVGIRRFASSQSDGLSFYQYLPAEKYVCEVNNLGSRVDLGLREATMRRRQLVDPPPEDWLARVGLSRLAFGQDVADRHTHVLLSVRDRCLLLVNGLLRLDLPPRKCTPSTIGRSLVGRNADAAVVASLKHLDHVVMSIEDARNRHSHRGEQRSVASHGPMRRIEECLAAFGQSRILPAESVTHSLNDLHAQLETEYYNTSKAVEKLSAALLPLFLEQVEALGGIAPPTCTEAKRAEEVIDYFAGGPKPTWMAAP